MQWIAQLIREGDQLEWTSLKKPEIKREVHVYPKDDLVIHTLDECCGCNPSNKEGNNLWTHNAWDNREAWENLTLI